MTRPIRRYPDHREDPDPPRGGGSDRKTLWIVLGGFVLVVAVQLVLGYLGCQ